MLVICTPVLRELDYLKERLDAPDRAFLARKAIRLINDLLNGRISIPDHIRIERYHREARKAYSYDEEIFLLAERYAREHPHGTVILLTSDINLSNLAHGSIVQAVAPRDWIARRERERLFWVARLIDEGVRKALERQADLERQLAKAKTAGDQDLIRRLEEQLEQERVQVDREIERFAHDWRLYNQEVAAIAIRGHEDIIQASIERRRYQNELYRLEALGASSELTIARERFRWAYEVELAKVKIYQAERARQEAVQEAKRWQQEAEHWRLEVERMRQEAERMSQKVGQANRGRLEAERARQEAVQEAEHWRSEVECMRQADRAYRTSRKALASLILSALSLHAVILGVISPILGLSPYLWPILGIILGNKAKREIANNPQVLKGQDLAQAGVILGWTTLALNILWIGAISSLRSPTP